MSEGREAGEGTGDELAELTPEERDAILAAAALAYTPDAGAMPSELRAKVEAQARAHFGKRAKEHARARAEERPAQASAGSSTTAAGAQVVVALDEVRAARRSSPLASLVTWGGWAAAAAAIVVLAARSRGDAPAPSAPASASPNVGAEEQVFGAREGNGATVRFDRQEGLGLVKVPASVVGSADELLEVWITFAGDTAPRLVATSPSPSGPGLAFGPVCRPVAVGALRCAPIAEVVVTRERAPGVAVLREAAVVARVSAPPAR